MIWGRTEYSVAFDSLTTADYGGGRVTQFGQTMTLAATAVAHDGEKLDIAIAPQAVFFLRDEAGARLGAIVIARYDTGRNSMGAAVSWSGATHSSGTNPAAAVDAGVGFARQLQGSRLLQRFTPHGNVVWERPAGVRTTVSVFEGVEYQVTGRLAFDLSGQHFGIPGGGREHQVVFGMTVSLGRVQ